MRGSLYSNSESKFWNRNPRIIFGSEIWQNFFLGHSSQLQVSFFQSRVRFNGIDERVVGPLLALVKNVNLSLRERQFQGRQL